MAEEPTTPTGPWLGRVRFAPGGGFAYRPGEILVREGVTELAVESLRRSSRLAADGDELRLRREERSHGAFVRLSGDFDALDALGVLEEDGIPAQPNHVLFTTGCCPPHPASPEAESFYANPYYARALAANPYYARPYYAKPYYARAGGGAGCCCCCGGGGTSANPYYAKAVGANPYYARADTNPAFDPSNQDTGRRRSSARPAEEPDLTGAKDAADGQVRVAILDTGWAESHEPTGLSGMHLVQQGGDRPDADGDGFLDPAAGHGTFIAGIVEQEAPGCTLEVISVLSTYGDGDETAVADTLLDLAARPDDERPHLVNLSFGGYTPVGMAVLADAIAQLRRAGSVVVASAGNDATCEPLFPAAFPGVISVGALDEDDNAAPFTNYGPWVDASTDGVDVVSIFFEGFDGAEPPTPDDVDEDEFEGWAVWSGTSFSAPRVVAALARLIQGGTDPADAVEQLIDDPSLDRKPMLGTVI